MNRTEDDYLRALANSFMIPADNAHGVHPNYSDKTDLTNRPYLNGGIVIKYSANQKSTLQRRCIVAIAKTICDRAEVPYRIFANRSDMLGGSTLGNISNTQVAVNTVISTVSTCDAFAIQTCGIKDTYYLIKRG